MEARLDALPDARLDSWIEPGLNRRVGPGCGRDVVGARPETQCPDAFPAGSSRPAALNAPWMFTWQARPVFSM